MQTQSIVIWEKHKENYTYSPTAVRKECSCQAFLPFDTMWAAQQPFPTTEASVHQSRALPSAGLRGIMSLLLFAGFIKVKLLYHLVY